MHPLWYLFGGGLCVLFGYHLRNQHEQQTKAAKPVDVFRQCVENQCRKELSK